MLLKAIFWTCLALLAWTYAGYPLVMLARARWSRAVRRPPVSPERASSGSASPRVTVVLAVRNGGQRLSARVMNLLEQEYPAQALEVVVALNGCTDHSEAVARRLAELDDRVRVVVSPAADGKAGALNAGVAAASGAIIAFADVRQRWAPDVVELLSGALADDRVGAVTGRLVIGAGGRRAVRGMRQYWSAETRLREAEARTGSVIGATGAIYALRRELYPGIPAGTILDDVYVPLRVALAGRRVVMEPAAVAHDEPTPRQSGEYRRRVRTLLGNIELVRLLPGLLLPWRPLFFRFVSHKLLRVLSPVFLLLLMAAGLLLDAQPYRAVAVAEGTVLALGVVGLGSSLAPLALPAAFVMIQAAALEALLWPRRRASDVWTP